MVPLIVADSPTVALAHTHVPLLSKEIFDELVVVVFSVDDGVSVVEVLEVSDDASEEDSDESSEFSMANWKFSSLSLLQFENKIIRNKKSINFLIVLILYDKCK